MSCIVHAYFRLCSTDECNKMSYFARFFDLLSDECKMAQCGILNGHFAKGTILQVQCIPFVCVFFFFNIAFILLYLYDFLWGIIIIIFFSF